MTVLFYAIEGVILAAAIVLVALVLRAAFRASRPDFEWEPEWPEDGALPASPLSAITIVVDDEDDHFTISVPEDADPIWVLWALNEATGMYLQLAFADD